MAELGLMVFAGTGMLTEYTGPSWVALKVFACVMGTWLMFPGVTMMGKLCVSCM